jgi:hypothetical protein
LTHEGIIREKSNRIPNKKAIQMDLRASFKAQARIEKEIGGIDK